jgi:type II secretory pathway pseudopilin PulG
MWKDRELIMRTNNKKRAFTVLEVLLAVTVFAMFFSAIMGYFSNTANRAALTTWRSNLKKGLAAKLPQVITDFEKASYPSAVFPKSTVIFDGAAMPSTGDADSDPTSKYYARYLEGEALGDAKSDVKLLSWYMCIPRYDPTVKDSMSQESWDRFTAGKPEVLCELFMRMENGIPKLVYVKDGNSLTIGSGLEKVTIQGKSIKPPGYEKYKDATYGSTTEKKYNPWDDQGVINVVFVFNAKYSHLDKGTKSDQATIVEKVTFKSGVRIQSL